MTLAVRAVLLVVFYLFLVLTPLLLASLGAGPRRGFVLELSVALGFVGLAVMGLQFALVARFHAVSAPFGQDAVMLFHRQMGYVALALILAHPVLLFMIGFDPARLLNPVTAPWPTRFGLLALVGLIVLTAISVWRQPLRISYEVWQLAHGVLAVLVVSAALVHIFLTGYYVDQPWKRLFWLAYSLSLIGLLVWVRIVKPIQLNRRHWRLRRVIPERGKTTTLEIVPEGHPGVVFEPGQFAWLTIGNSPFAFTRHPFSFSSSAERTEDIQFSIKALGDFTKTVPDLPPGQRVYIDGPFGVFSPDRWEGPGFVLIGGGIGVTPLMSMLRTFADREDVRPVYLFLGNPSREEITFREEIEALKERMNLTVVHVLSRPDESWSGERGRIDIELLGQYLPLQYRRFRYFVCGPPGLMDAMQTGLPLIGVSEDRIHTERFEFM